MLTLLALAAHAAPDTLTVLVCSDPHGCEDAARAALEAHDDAGLPLVGFDEVAAAGPAGEDALRRWEIARSELAADPEAALEALRALPFTVSREDLVAVWAAQPDGEAAVASITGREPRELYILTVSADVHVATVYVDGVSVGPAPAHVALTPGWHRITVERPGRRTAWVQEVDLHGESVLTAIVSPDDAAPALQAAISGAMHGVSPPPDVTHALTTWAESREVDTLRFVDGASVAVLADGVWSLDDPGPGRARPTRVHLGVTSGWLRLDGRDHIAISAPIDLRLGERLALELTPGVIRSPEPVLLYDDVVSRQLYPVAVGLRLGDDTGPYASLSGLAIVPWALGGRAAVGWDLDASRRVGLRVESALVVTDRGIGAGVQAGLRLPARNTDRRLGGAS